MKVAVIGSRGLEVHNLEQYLPAETTEIVSGGARGVDTCARKYALAHAMKLTEFLPEYKNTEKVRRSGATLRLFSTPTLSLRFGMDIRGAQGL